MRGRASSFGAKTSSIGLLFTADGAALIISGATGQGERENGQWKPWGRLQAYRVG